MTSSPTAPSRSAAQGDITWYPRPDDAAAADRVRQEFVAAHGREPDGIWSAPGRVNLIGEHVDYNGGLCLPFALPHRTFVALAVRDDGRLDVRSAQRGEEAFRGALDDVHPGAVQRGMPGWAGYVAGVPWALAQAGHAVPGFDAVVDGVVPVGAGLSSSAALECAVAVALDDVAGLGLAGDGPAGGDAGRAALAAACVRCENEIAGAPTGGMDQAASLRTRAGHALLLDCRDFSVRQVPLDLAAAGTELLVVDTRAHHELVDGQYGSRRQQCEEAARILGVASLREVPPGGLDGALGRVARAVEDPEQADEVGRRVRHVVTEIARVGAAVSLLDAAAGPGGVPDGDWVRPLGALLDASHASLRDDYEVSCAELDAVCEAATGAGAHGARMTGGGFGGSAIALVPADRRDDVAAAVAQAFSRNGFAAPAFLVATPSGPAGRTA